MLRDIFQMEGFGFMDLLEFDARSFCCCGHNKNHSVFSLVLKLNKDESNLHLCPKSRIYFDFGFYIFAIFVTLLGYDFLIQILILEMFLVPIFQ